MDKIKLKLSATDEVFVDPADINYCEYRSNWGRQQYPAIKVYMKDRTQVYVVDYADEFKPLWAEFKKHNINLKD